MLTLFGKPEPSLLDRLKQSVTKTREQLSSRLAPLLSPGREIDPQLFLELETSLLAADLGVGTTRELLAGLREQAARGELHDAAELKAALKRRLTEMLRPAPAAAAGNNARPQVIFVVGVNGTGKTTTIGKIAWRLKQEGRSALICAADTFRAAAAEQLEIWGRRSGADVVRQKTGADPAAVVYDGLSAALGRQTDVVIVDTAGRLHTKHNLMAELEKMRRTAAKLLPGAPHDVLLVLDATTGQNGLVQAREFTAHTGVTALVLTKLDGTAKGGIVVAIARELGLPVRFVGTGEKVDDLVPFDPVAFVNSLFE
ncbi:MAG TPA: signal recognition particle-docking protein FtsY [Candidatus Acidoferrales bacterium]|nr:signal recognition particle-docking protein FtsY [Candidatus Acidoferrales bacterium]